MAAVVIFTPRSNSQDFDERRIALCESVKIGRSVAKVKSSSTNCIFDCKVLSRNHAIVWYEGGKFYLQDTKSSNGTFVNNNRLSKGTEESEPKELHSGDIVQFGVEVVENSKRGAVTHGCIIATLSLFGPDGKEATRNVNASPFQPLGAAGIQSYELFQLSQYIQDALHREQILENKIVTLQRIISETQTNTDGTFESIIQEDKLLTRLETLENHLDIFTKNCTEDEMKLEIVRLHDDKNRYEMASKESLRQVTEEKLRAIEKLSDLEKSCSNAEDECSHYQSLYERAQKELEDLAEKHRQRLDEMRTLHDQIEKSERRHIALEEQMNNERESTNEKLNISSRKELEYISRLESLQAECDFRKEQLVAMRAQMDKKNNASNHIQQNNVESDGKASLTLVEETIQVLKGKLQDLQEESKIKQEDVNVIKAKLDLYETNESNEDTTDLQSLQNELLVSEGNLKQIRENIDVLEEQLMCCHLKAVDNLEEHDDSNSLIVNKASEESTTDFGNHMSYHEGETDYEWDMLDDLEAELLNIRNQMKSHSKTDIEDLPVAVPDENARRNELVLLKCMRHVQYIKDEIDELLSGRRSILAVVPGDDSSPRSGEPTVSELRDRLRNAENNASEVRQEILALRDKLLEEQDTARMREETIAQLRTHIEELTRSNSLSELEKTTEHRVAESAKSTAKHMQKQAALSAEKASKNKVLLRTLQEENKFLIQKVQTLESELKWSRKEKLRLTGKSKHDSTQQNHKSLHSSIDADHVTEVEERLHNSLGHEETRPTAINTLQEQDSRLKFCLLPMFFLLLAILVTFSLGILGSAKDKTGASSTGGSGG